MSRSLYRYGNPACLDPATRSALVLGVVQHGRLRLSPRVVRAIAAGGVKTYHDGRGTIITCPQCRQRRLYQGSVVIGVLLDPRRKQLI